MPMRPVSRFAERNPIALAFRADAQRVGDEHVLVGELRGIGRLLPELALDGTDAESRRRHGHEERADAALARGGVRDGERDDGSGDAPRGDELLDAVQPIAALDAARAHAQRSRVRTRLRFRQRERADHRARGERLQVALLLRRRAPGHEDRADRGVVDAHERGERAVARRDLDERERVRDIVEPRAAERLRHRHAEEAELAHLAQHVLGNRAGGLPGAALRRDALARELARRLPNEFLRFREYHSSHLLHEDGVRHRSCYTARAPGLHGPRQFVRATIRLSRPTTTDTPASVIAPPRSMRGVSWSPRIDTLNSTPQTGVSNVTGARVVTGYLPSR